MIIKRLVNRRMKLAEVEAQLYELGERRLALINQINILVEMQQEEKTRKEKEEEINKKKEKNNDK